MIAVATVTNAGHLIHHFGLTEQDWRKIKQNIDSKCRTAFRRKLRGLPLAVKAFRAKANGSDGGDGDGELQHASDDSPGTAPPEIVWCEQELGSCGSEDDALQHLTDDTHLAMHEVSDRCQLPRCQWYYS